MYIVISKPKRMSLAAGFSHVIQFLLVARAASRGKTCRQVIYQYQISVRCLDALRHRENTQGRLMIFMIFRKTRCFGVSDLIGHAGDRIRAVIGLALWA
jgi:hypothetical protein